MNPGTVAFVAFAACLATGISISRMAGLAWQRWIPAAIVTSTLVALVTYWTQTK